MRFLISAVLTLPDSPSAKELAKINTTSAWILNRTSSLPDYSPRRRPEGGRPAAATSRSATTPAIIVTDSHLAASGCSPEAEQSTYFSRRGSWHSVHSSHSIASAASSDQAYSDQGQDDTVTMGGAYSPAKNHSRQTSAGFQLQQQPGGSCSSHSHSPSPSSPPSSSPDPPPEPDFLYQTVRLAAIIYARAITTRQPFSSVVSPADFQQLSGALWRVPLPVWKGVLGVFGWIIAALAPAAERLESSGSGGGRRHARFVKSMLANSLLQMGTDNWELARGAMGAAGRLQRWLGEGDGELGQL
jgi:hypothetical protein